MLKCHNSLTNNVAYLLTNHFNIKHLKFDAIDQDFTAIFVRLCKICERGGFSQSQSHIMFMHWLHTDTYIGIKVD